LVCKIKTANSYGPATKSKNCCNHQTSFLLASSLPVVIPSHSDSGTSSSYQFFNFGASKLPRLKTGRFTTSVDPLVESETRSGNQCPMRLPTNALTRPLSCSFLLFLLQGPNRLEGSLHKPNTNTRLQRRSSA
jgi:hypothetical protein